MNKKLIAVAIAAAVAAPAAMANDTTLYGKIHASIDAVDSDAAVIDNWQVNDRGSRLGVKGSEDLGNGLKAIFKYETNMQGYHSGAVAGGMRNSYVGIAGDFGTFLVGNHDTPVKVALYGSGTEMLADSIIQLAHSDGGGNVQSLGNFTETRAANAIAYISPSFSGLTVAAAIIPGEGTGAGATATDLADSYSVAAIYGGNGIKASIGFEDVTAAYEMWQFGASYTMDAFTIGALYQDQENAAGTVDSEIWAVTGKANFGQNAVIASYTATESGATDGDGFGIAVTHNMSKRTQVYAAYTDKEVDGAAATVTSAAGNVFNQGSAFSIGMFHSF